MSWLALKNSLRLSNILTQHRYYEKERYQNLYYLRRKLEWSRKGLLGKKAASFRNILRKDLSSFPRPRIQINPPHYKETMKKNQKKVIKAWAVVEKGRIIPYGSATDQYTLHKWSAKPAVNHGFQVVPVEITLNP